MIAGNASPLLRAKQSRLHLQVVPPSILLHVHLRDNVPRMQRAGMGWRSLRAAKDFSGSRFQIFVCADHFDKGGFAAAGIGMRALDRGLIGIAQGARAERSGERQAEYPARGKLLAARRVIGRLRTFRSGPGMLPLGLVLARIRFLCTFSRNPQLLLEKGAMRAKFAKLLRLPQIGLGQVAQIIGKLYARRRYAPAARCAEHQDNEDAGAKEPIYFSHGMLVRASGFRLGAI